MDELQVLDFYFLSECLGAMKSQPSSNFPLLYLDLCNVTILQAEGTAHVTFYDGSENVSQRLLIFLMVDHCRNFRHLVFMVVNINSWEALIVMTVGSNHEKLIFEENWFRSIFHSNCVTISLPLLPNSKEG